MRNPVVPPQPRFNSAILESIATWPAMGRAVGGRMIDAWAGGEPVYRHSRRVALLKRVLPAIGIALLLLVAAWPRLAPLWEHLRMSFPAIDLREARELKMIHPRYAGLDREGRPFVVTAASGRQLADRQDLMSLQMPHGDIKTHSGADITVTADTGVYQSQTQLLDLFGNVTLVHQNGTRFVTQSARVNAATNTAEGHDPVTGHGPSGDIKAQGFRVLDRGDTILFTGRCDLLLRSTKPSAARSAPAGLPPPIAAEAARTAAEAKPLLQAARPVPVERHRAAHHAAPHHAVLPHRAAPHHTASRDSRHSAGQSRTGHLAERGH